MKGVISIFARFKNYYKEYAFYFILAIIGMILAGGGSAASAYLVQPVLDKIFIEKNKDLLYLLPYAVIAVYFAKSAGTFMQAYFTNYIGQDIVRRFRYMLLERLLYLDMEFFNKIRTGELISRNTNDIERIRTIVSTIVPELIREIITIIGLLGVVIYQSPKLAFFALIVFPAAIYPLSKLAKKMKNLSRKSQETISDLSSTLSEIFSNIELVKANNAEKKELTRFSEHNENYFKFNIKSVKTNELVSPMMETLGAIGLAVVIIIGGTEVINGKMTPGSFFSFAAALFMLYTPIKRVSSLYNRSQDAVVASERTFELLDKIPSIVGGNSNFPSEIYNISFEDVYLKYDKKSVLNGINFKVNQGQMIGIVGTSGGGKTSLINLLMRFYDPSSGNVLINQNDICDFSLKTLREHIGLVTQRIYIFNDTIAANVAYSGKFDEEKVINALKMANAWDFVSSLKDGIWSKLDEFGANLSGGQRQRIAIARALYKDPEILIFDEATSALDNESEKYISDVIQSFRSKKIIFVIAHRLSTIKNADKILVLDGGKIVGFDTEANLEQNCQIYKNLKTLSN
nr:ABC transporter ATP-binding protein [Campylobacter sp.]